MNMEQITVINGNIPNNQINYNKTKILKLPTLMTIKINNKTNNSSQ